MAGGRRDPGQTDAISGCPSQEILLRFVEGTVAAADEAPLSGHLDQCSTCRQLVVELTHGRTIGSGAPAPTTGQIVGKYRLEEQLGQGGMGVVFRARDLRLGRAVALKFISAQSRGDPQAAARLTREARAASALEHPNVGGVLEIGEDHGHLYIAMALIEGVTLRDRLANGPLPIGEAVGILRQLAAALAAAHAGGIIHRDIKPSNVMLTPSGTVKLFDFGLAKFLEPPAPEQSLTGTGQILGTVGYMAPELLQSRPIDHRADLWALGVVAYEMVVGVAPFRGETAPITIGAILTGAIVPPSRSRPEVPRELEQLILALLERSPQRRLGDAATVKRRLAAIEAGSPTTRRRARGALVALAACIVVAASALAVHHWRAVRARRAVDDARPPRRTSIALLGLANTSGAADRAWLSTAIAEILTAEVTHGEALRTVPAEDVARVERDLALTAAAGYPAATLARLRRALDADYIVSGSYRASDASLELELALQDVRTGATTSVEEHGSPRQLFGLVSHAGRAIRARLGGARAAPDARASTAPALPGDLEAARSYADGIARLHAGELLGARDRLERVLAIAPRYTQAHAALAQVWSGLGYDARARAEAQIAFEGSSGLPREERLLVEARYRESSHDWDNAIDIYRALVRFFPDELDYGLALAHAENAASRPKAAMATLALLRRLPTPSGDDPRIDLEEAAADDVLGDPRAEAVAAAAAARKARENGARAVVGHADIAAAWALRNLGEHARALAAIDEARAIFGDLADRDGLGEAVHTLGTILYSQGDLTGAIAKEREALAILRGVGDQKKIGFVLNSIACDQQEIGELEEARGGFAEVLGLAREMEVPSEIGLALANLGGVDLDLAAFGQARAELAEALPLAREAGDRRVEGNVLYSLAEIAHHTGDFGAAAKQLGEVVRLSHATPDPTVEAFELASLADVRFEEGRLSEARATYDHAIAVQSADPLPVTIGRLGLATIALEEGRARDAGGLARAAAQAFAAQGRWSFEAGAWSVVAESALARDDLAAANDGLAHAEPTKIKRLWINDRMKVAIASARAAARAGQPDAAIARLRANLAAAKKVGLVAHALETRLAIVEIEARSGKKAEARAERAALEADAARRGYARIAARARRLAAACE
jgi:eukaryotic-like serine/threonine-protein kinase